MIDRSFTNFAVTDLKAEIKTISNGVGRIKNFDHSNSDFSKHEELPLDVQNSSVLRAYTESTVTPHSIDLLPTVARE